MFFTDSEIKAVPVTFGARDVPERDQDTLENGILLTERKVAVWLRESPGTRI